MRRSAAGGTSNTVSSLAVVSWAAYDFANTIFSISILSYFFPLWLGDELGGGADLFNYVTAASMLLVVATAPFFGAIGDLRQRRKPFLVAFTLAAVGCTLGATLEWACSCWPCCSIRTPRTPWSPTCRSTAG